MNNFFKILNLIILGILILIFILYNLRSGFNNDSANKIKETFQNQDVNYDINTVFFDLSANYFRLLESEKAEQPPSVPDTVILDIGGAFGEYDASRIPWDAENKELLPSEALYGAVPANVSAALFGKLDEANKLADVNKLPFDEDNLNIKYDSPDFQEDPDAAEKEEKDYEVAVQVTTMVAAMFLSELIETGFEKASLRKGLTGALTAPIKLVGMVLKTFDNFFMGGIGNRAVSKGLELLPKRTKVVKPKKLGKLNAQKTVVGNIDKMASKLGESVAKRIKGKYSKIVAKAATKLVTKLVLTSIVLSVSLKAIPPPWIGGVLGTIYDMVITPIVLVLSLSGVIDKAIEKSSDEEGCCPPNSVPLDSIIPGPLNDILIGNIPIIGDILGFFYPYVCSQNGTGNLVFKLTLTIPKYMKYPWLSCYYLDWPDYNCRVGGVSPVRGKRLVGNAYDWDNSGIGYYTGLNDVIANPENFKQEVWELKLGKKVMTNTERIVPEGRRFVYADFTEPKMLIDMGQFYYDWASKDYYPNDDGTVTIEYISKINYVAASSLYTCDVNCEMMSITFNPTNGENYSETITYDRDRRFYYRVTTLSNAPRFWEDATDATWRTLDDTYDLAMNDLNNFIYQERFRNTQLDATVLTAAYRQMLDNSNRLTFISNIAMSNFAVTETRTDPTNPTSPITTSNNAAKFSQSIIDFSRTFITSRQTLSNIPRKYLNGFNSNDDLTLATKLNSIVVASNQLWEHHKSRPTSAIDTYRNNQYKIMGCTKIDSTASGAINPDPLNLEEDTRYFTNFDVIPYIKRCGSTHIDINKCIDPSNIELIIYNYYLQNPNKRIKTINNIKARGKNACEFIWDEVTYNPSTKGETDYKKDVNTKIVYQQDLSSCVFALPEPIAISGTSNYLFGTQTGGTNGLQLPPTSIKMFKNPLSSSSKNFAENTTLSNIQATFKFPVLPTLAEKINLPVNQQNRPKRFIESNVDYVPRFDPGKFTSLPDLVRPKKPIRVRYPNEDQKFLGNQTSNYCSDPRTMSNIIMNYNGDSNNVNKISKIIRTFTSSSNTCDLEVDMYIKDTKKIERRTVTFNVKREGFQNPFTYDSLNSSAYGLSINTETDPLSNPFQDGLGYSAPYLRSFTNEIIPNTTYFSDNLIKDFTDKTKKLRDGNYRILQGLVGTQKLGNPTCNKKCSDDDIVQRIIEQYNKDGVPVTRYDVKQESVRQVINSATASTNRCHVIFDNKNDYYTDYYTDTSKLKDSSNYSSDFRLALKEVKMADAGNCVFYPLANQEYKDISASDLALTSSSNFNTYKKPVRSSCVPVNCGNQSLLNSALTDYKNATSNTVSNVKRAITIGTNTCDYLISSEIYIPNLEEHLPEDDYILRVNYNNTLYNQNTGSNCSLNNTYSYVNGNFKLHISDDSMEELGVDMDNYEIVDSNSKILSPLMTYDPLTPNSIDSKIININF
jgi:hypothetical protein